jgi:hypothetical protein
VVVVVVVVVVMVLLLVVVVVLLLLVVVVLLLLHIVWPLCVPPLWLLQLLLCRAQREAHHRGHLPAAREVLLNICRICRPPRGIARKLRC